MQSDDTNLIELDVEERHVIEICACRPWNTSNVKVEKGQKYIFSKVELTEPWVDGTVESSPEDGWISTFYNIMGHTVSFWKRSNKANWYALIGTVEKQDEETFPVFTKRPNDLSVTMTRSGVLYFYANDKNGRYFNNQGALQLRITRVE